MKQFLINEQQVDLLGKILLEIPARISLQGIDILRALQPYYDTKEPMCAANAE